MVWHKCSILYIFWFSLSGSLVPQSFSSHGWLVGREEERSTSWKEHVESYSALTLYYACDVHSNWIADTEHVLAPNYRCRLEGADELSSSLQDMLRTATQPYEKRHELLGLAGREIVNWTVGPATLKFPGRSHSNFLNGRECVVHAVLSAQNLFPNIWKNKPVQIWGIDSRDSLYNTQNSHADESSDQRQFMLDDEGAIVSFSPDASMLCNKVFTLCSIMQYEVYCTEMAERSRSWKTVTLRAKGRERSQLAQSLCPNMTRIC